MAQENIPVSVELYGPEFYDELTGLANGRLFDITCKERITLTDEGLNGPFAVIYIDTDGLKPINDAHTHRGGDALLRFYADILTGSAGAGDLVARLHNTGDEFAWLHIIPMPPDTADTEAYARQHLAETLDALRTATADVHTPFSEKLGVRVTDIGHHRIGMSIGGALYMPGSNLTPQDLLHEGDTNMRYDKMERFRAYLASLPPARSAMLKQGLTYNGMGDTLIRAATGEDPRRFLGRI